MQKEKAMSINEEFTYEEWFDIFRSCVRSNEYKGRIDYEGVRSYYDDDVSPDVAAEEFVIQML